MAEVVLVDDDPIAREVGGDALREAGHAVRVADGGPRMMQLLLERPAEVLVLDVNIPGMSGDRLAKVLSKSLDPPHPKILLFSGLPAAELRRLARKLRVTGWVRKGCPKEQLLRAVEAAARVFRGELTEPQHPPRVDTVPARRLPEPMDPD